jgi:hypothetical protein
MVTNCAEGLAATGPVEVKLDGSMPLGLYSRFRRSVRRTLCGLRGHDTLLSFEKSRVRLTCTACGYETPGWEIAAERPRVRFQGDARRHVLMRRPTLVVVRKSA